MLNSNNGQNAAVNEIDIEASGKNLGTVLSFVEQMLEMTGCPLKYQMQISVAVEEIFINIANYAYAPGKGRARVRIEISDDPAGIKIIFADKGRHYDPLKKEDPDISLSADKRPIGGLGIFMVKKTMDDVKYEYKDGQNILTLIKYF